MSTNKEQALPELFNSRDELEGGGHADSWREDPPEDDSELIKEKIDREAVSYSLASHREALEKHKEEGVRLEVADLGLRLDKLGDPRAAGLRRRLKDITGE